MSLIPPFHRLPIPDKLRQKGEEYRGQADVQARSQHGKERRPHQIHLRIIDLRWFLSLYRDFESNKD